MNRRGFILSISGSLLALPSLEAPKCRRERVGSAFCHRTSRRRGVSGHPCTHQALGWIEGKNIIVEPRSADAKLTRLRPLADELVALRVDVVVTYGTEATAAAKSATTSIPIVMASAGDPVGMGLVATLAHPGGNITGYSTGASQKTVMGSMGWWT